LKNDHQSPRQTNTADLKIDIKAWAWKFLSYWWLFLLSLGVLIAVGQAYLRYSTPQYMTSAKLLIKGAGGSSNLSELSILSEGLGLASSGKDLTNEIEILKSRPIVTKVIEKLNANITYFRQGVIRNTELYTDSPIILNNHSLSGDRDRLTFYVKMGYYQEFEFRIHEDEEGSVHTFGEEFENEYGRFLISQSATAKLVPGTFQVNIMHPEDVANYYKNALIIEVIGMQRASSILELKLIDQTPIKARDFLNTLIEIYNDAEVDDNTQLLQSTVTFVDDRIAQIAVELDSIEGVIEKFKQENNIITETAASSLDFPLVELRSSIAKTSSLEIERDLLSALQKNLSENPESLIPTTVLSVAPTLGSLIEEYNSILLNRKRLLKTITPENPIIEQANIELNDLKNLIQTSVYTLQKNLEIPLSQAREEIIKLRKDLTGVPSVEKSLIEKLRMQTIKENLYLFLLQKKEETELSMAISTANTRIIESARSNGGALFPNKKIIRLGSILSGLFLPILIIVLLDLLVTTVESEETIKSLTTIPVIGRIPHYHAKKEFLLQHGERSIRAEMFNLLRTNLNFTAAKNKQQVLVITSSSSGEGKSITAINLGITLSFSAKKIVVVDMDLRKPKIGEYLKSHQASGVSNYLIGESNLKDILTEHPDYPNLHYIVSGPIPPNPTELIMSDRTQTMIEELKKDFDYIIIDCPPIGVVTDGLLLRDYLTKMLYVIRHKKTKKESLKILEEQYLQGELVNPNIIINDIDVNRKNSSYGGYTSEYGYGYYMKK
jgi:tyrosine-protein kinase Etk/Wzc